jgi:hypothetical protein
MPGFCGFWAVKAEIGRLKKTGERAGFFVDTFLHGNNS